MSVQALAAVFSLEIESPTVKLVLLGLANYCDQKGRCWPSQREIGAITSLSERAVRDALNVLVAEGWVSREERRRPDGSRSTDVITLLFLQPAASADCNRNEPETQPAPAAGGGARRAGGGAGGAGLTTFEPSNNTSPIANALGESPPAKIDRLKGSRLAPDWQPEKLIGIEDARCTTALATAELAKFRDYWIAQPGVKGRKLDWEATWRNWLRGTLDRMPIPPPDRTATVIDAEAIARRREENLRRYGGAS